MIAVLTEPYSQFPVAKIALSPDPFAGYITIVPYFFGEDGIRLDPRIGANVSFSIDGMTIQEAELWGTIFTAAAMIARRRSAPWFSDELMQVYVALWARVDEIEAERRG
jgi:hypothetical protein